MDESVIAGVLERGSSRRLPAIGAVVGLVVVGFFGSLFASGILSFGPAG